MKLFYYKHPRKVTNFGDDLNPWLWGELLGDVFDETSDDLLIGIGTLLNNRLPSARRTFVFSSGVGYGDHPPQINESWTIYCVRGPLSARALSLPEETAITDGAAFLRRLYKSEGTQKQYRFSYCPHVVNAEKGAGQWQRICEELGFGYIDPREPLEEVFRKISRTDVLMTEAMHGAIVADTLRVPWIPVHTSSAILPFKWLDWTLSMNVPYQPEYLPMPEDVAKWYKLGRHWESWQKASVVKRQLRQISQTAKPCLSAESILETRVAQLEERLQALKRIVANPS